MKAVTVRANSWMPRNQVVLMAAPHPEVPLLTPVEEAECLLIACHPDIEQKVRDVIAVEQERPRWWREWQRIERVMLNLS